MFNTGTVVCVFSNIFGSGFPRNFVPSFSWGGPQGFTTYLTPKAFEVAKLLCQEEILSSPNKMNLFWQLYLIKRKLTEIYKLICFFYALKI